MRVFAARFAEKTRREAELFEAMPAIPPWKEITEEDLRMVAEVKALHARVKPPIHSNFLVCAVITYYDSTWRVRHVLGVNSETCVLPSSLCAERCALNQLRLQPEGFRNIRSVYITTSLPEVITPGLLCREYMSEFGPGQTRVFLCTHDWEPAHHECGQPAPHTHILRGSRGKGGPSVAERPYVCSSVSDRVGQHVIMRLCDLFPLPSVYRAVPRDAVLDTARSIASRLRTYTFYHAAAAMHPEALDDAPSAPWVCVHPHFDVADLPVQLHSDLDRKMRQILSPSDKAVNPAAALRVLSHAVEELYEEAVRVASHTVPADSLYPIHYAAGVMFQDGTTAVARQDKALEYGCSADACVKLSTACLAAQARGVAPMLLLQVDQWGICHAPHALARSWFVENGFGSVLCYAHDVDSGQVVRVSILELAPAVPLINLS